MGATIAGNNVFSVLDWSTWSGSYPLIFLQTPTEEKESLGRQGAPQFTVTSTLRIDARVTAPAQVNGAGAAAALAQLEVFQQQIEIALINYPPLMQLIQCVPFVRVKMDVNAEGAQNLGEMVMDMGLEFYQGPEDFYPIHTDPLTEITVDADLVNVADPTGTYLDPPFPDSVVPAPRTHGPDGRPEGGLDILLPQ